MTEQSSDIVKKTRVEKSYRRSFTPLVLWLEDVEDIYGLLEANSESVEISDDDYVFKSLQAAKEHFGTEPVYKLKFTTSRPYAVFEGDRFSASWYVGASDKSAKLYYEVGDRLAARQRWPRPLFRWYANLVLPFLVVVVGSTYDSGTKFSWSVAAAMAAQVILLLLMLHAAFIGSRRTLVVHFVRRSEKKGFFARNKDQLLMFVITSLVSAAIGFAAGQMKDRYFPPSSPTTTAR